MALISCAPSWGVGNRILMYRSATACPPGVPTVQMESVCVCGEARYRDVTACRDVWWLVALAFWMVRGFGASGLRCFDG